EPSLRMCGHFRPAFCLWPGLTLSAGSRGLASLPANIGHDDGWTGAWPLGSRNVPLVGVALPWRSQELKRCNGPVAGGGWFGVARVDPGIDLVQGRHGAGGFGYSPALSGVDPNAGELRPGGGCQVFAPADGGWGEVAGRGGGDLGDPPAGALVASGFGVPAAGR